MQAEALSRTSGARNPIVIVKIFIFIFLRPKVVLQASSARNPIVIVKIFRAQAGHRPVRSLL